MTPEFVEVFGKMEFAGGQKCRRISDIDMIFSNVIRTADGPELIDYEWTFDFPVPLAFLRYRCLYYYILGNAKREKLKEAGLYEQFGIDPAMQKQFAAMEQQFQKYMLGSYCPVWKLYAEISDGVIDVLPLTDRESRARVRRSVEVYFDDGRGFGTWNWKKYRIPQEGRVTLQIPLPEGTHCVRLDPSTERCILRIESLRQNGCDLPYTTNGVPARNGDVIFDLPDPQIYFEVTGNTAVEAVFFAEPLEGLSRELILHQHGRLRWMEQTRVWRLYKKLKGKE
jgi:hypothetical protein